MGQPTEGDRAFALTVKLCSRVCKGWKQHCNFFGSAVGQPPEGGRVFALTVKFCSRICKGRGQHGDFIRKFIISAVAMFISAVAVFAAENGNGGVGNVTAMTPKILLQRRIPAKWLVVDKNI